MACIPPELTLCQGCPLRPMVFIGHCFGGIVIERVSRERMVHHDLDADIVVKALVSAKLHEEDYPSFVRSVAGVVFLGTPHRGSSLQSKASVIASIASAVGLGEQSSLLKIAEKDSEMLADLLHDFTRTVDSMSMPLFCFFEQHKSDVARVLKPRGLKKLIPSVKVMLHFCRSSPY